jgi:hypothetical protein
MNRIKGILGISYKKPDLDTPKRAKKVDFQEVPAGWSLPKTKN